MNGSESNMIKQQANYILFLQISTARDILWINVRYSGI